MKQRLVLLAAGLIASAAAGLWVIEGASPPAPTSTVDALVPAPSPSPPPTEQTGRASQLAQLVSYAIPTAELQGLPPDLPPGSQIDLWVAVQPPVTEETQVHKLLDDVVVERIVAPLTPDGPHSAILMVDPEDVSDLIWGDRFGALSTVVPPAVAGG